MLFDICRKTIYHVLNSRGVGNKRVGGAKVVKSLNKIQKGKFCKIIINVEEGSRKTLRDESFNKLSWYIYKIIKCIIK